MRVHAGTCGARAHRAGTMATVAARRVVQYRAYAGSKARYLNEQYIELFDLDLVTLPRQLPVWLTRPLAVLRDEAADPIARPPSAGGHVAPPDRPAQETQG